MANKINHIAGKNRTVRGNTPSARKAPNKKGKRDSSSQNQELNLITVRRKCPHIEAEKYLKFLIEEYYGGEWKIEANALKQLLKDNNLYKYYKESGDVELDIPAVLVINGMIGRADKPKEPENFLTETASSVESKETITDAPGDEAPEPEKTAIDSYDTLKSKANRIALFGIGKHEKSDFLQVPCFHDTEKFEAWKEVGRNEAIHAACTKDGFDRFITELEQRLDQKEKELAKVKNEAVQKENKLNNERILLKGDLDRKTTALVSAEKENARLKAEIEAFGKNVRMKAALQQTATRMDVFFSNVDELLRQRDLLEASNRPADATLATRINSKYAAAVTRIDNLSDWRCDIANLAAAGIRLVNSKLITDSTDESSLLLRFHKYVASILGSAAMILADEYAHYMPGLYPARMDAARKFENLSRELEAILKGLGYSVTHVRYGDIMPPGVKNEKFAENPELESNQIAEVYKLGISYGSSTEDTIVSAKE